MTIELLDKVRRLIRPNTWEATFQRPDLKENPPVIKLIYPDQEKWAIVVPFGNNSYHLYHELNEKTIMPCCIPFVASEDLKSGQIILRMNDSTKVPVRIKLAGFVSDSPHRKRRWSQ